MTDADIGIFDERRRSNWIRLRTMILLRWFAITGQLTAILVAVSIYNLDMQTGLCFMAVGVSVIGNLVAMFIFPENKRLSETENLLMFVFDLLQLAFLLFLTGGLHNPFSLLLLGPVTVSAAVLPLGRTVFLNALAVLLVTGLVFFHLPLRTGDGQVLRIPDLFIFGQWAAITIAILFISVYSRRITREMHNMGDALAATQMALARAQKLNDLGGVVAATAHELGTPLATIKLTAAELIDELDDRPAQRDDAVLIAEQADRCRDILRSMGRAGKDDLHMRHAPLTEVIREASEPHENRGKAILIEVENRRGDGSLPPLVMRRPEIIHGLRNLVQNAVDFARSTVWIEVNWSDAVVSVRIVDDGRGFPPHLIGRIGDPFMRQRRNDKPRKERPGYEGMGLGLFIAKTLLEGSGAELSFANGSPPSRPNPDAGLHRGAIVEVVWPLSAIAVPEAEAHAPLGENALIDG
ncbi:sensor histidine kinase RegB [Roseivivax sp. CAU 1753]